MAKSKITYEFLDGTNYTAQVNAVYAHVNKPDEEYEKYSITVALPEGVSTTTDLFARTLDFENAVRRAQGLPAVEVPGNWTRNGKPNRDSEGNWLVTFEMGTTNSKGQDRSPALFNVHGEEDARVTVWGSDTVIVGFTIAAWYGGGSARAKYFLRGVQLIKEGDRKGNSGLAFQSQASAANMDTPSAAQESDTLTSESGGIDDSEVPF